MYIQESVQYMRNVTDIFSFAKRYEVPSKISFMFLVKNELFKEIFFDRKQTPIFSFTVTFK